MPRADNLADFIIATHAELGDRFAAWDTASAHIEPGVRSSRFAAWLAPFPDRKAAERALLEDGAVIAGER